MKFQRFRTIASPVAVSCLLVISQLNLARGAQVVVEISPNASADALQYFLVYWDTQSRRSDHNYAEVSQIFLSDCEVLDESSVSCTVDIPEMEKGNLYYFSLRNGYSPYEQSAFANEFVVSYGIPWGVPCVDTANCLPDLSVVDANQDHQIDGLDLADFARQIVAGSNVFSVEFFSSLYGADNGVFIEADVDLDNDVDGEDLGELAWQFAAGNATMPLDGLAKVFGNVLCGRDGYIEGDSDLDNDVDGEDLLVFAEQVAAGRATMSVGGFAKVFGKSL